MDMSPASLKGLANGIRLDVLGMSMRAKSSHIGSCFSCADLLTALYLGKVLRVDPKNPGWHGRDFFILSKGHASAVYYAVLARAGFFDASELGSYYQDASRMPGHPTRNCVPGVEASTGSLGHGLGLCCGLAMAAKLEKKGNRAFALLGDGELNEGSVWEAALFAGAKALDNLCAIVDYNHLQSFGTVEEVLPLEPLCDKFSSFGWDCARINGNSMEEICGLFQSPFMESRRPKLIVAETVKGKGVSFMENRLEWHYKNLSEQEYASAVAELRKNEM